MAHPLATIGYQSDTLAGVIARLKAAGVEVVIDVRAVAASRRPGFSKTMLGASLEEAGIGYAHLRALGTPKAGRDAARAGRIAEMRAIFEGHLAEPTAIAALAQAADIARERPAACSVSKRRLATVTAPSSPRNSAPFCAARWWIFSQIRAASWPLSN